MKVSDRISVVLVYTCYALLSVVFMVFFIMSLSESETAAMVGVSFFVACFLMYHTSSLVSCIFKAYGKISMKIMKRISECLTK